MTVPEAQAALVTSDLVTRQGHIVSLETRDGDQLIVARVPLSQLFGYASSLAHLMRSHTNHRLTFDGYQPITTIGLPTTTPPHRSARLLHHVRLRETQRPRFRSRTTTYSVTARPAYRFFGTSARSSRATVASKSLRNGEGPLKVSGWARK